MTNEVRMTDQEFRIPQEQDIPEIFQGFGEFFSAEKEIPRAPCMEIQAAMIREAFLNIPEVQYETWVGLTQEERLTALTQLEEEMAKIGLRDTLNVSCEKLGYCVLGHCNGVDLVVSEGGLMDNSYIGYRRLMETFFHEARHGYQIYNLLVQRVESNEAMVNAWEENFFGEKGYVRSRLSFRDIGFMRYQEQPVEVDARVFAELMLQELELGRVRR